MEFRIYHTTRHLAKHAFELDDHLYGAPVMKPDVDWAIEKPEKYLEDLKKEKIFLSRRLNDLVYLLKNKKQEIGVAPDELLKQEVSNEEADAHIYHRFTYRSFNYVEKLSFLLEQNTPEEIALDIPKAKRQLNALLAAIEDVNISIKRFSSFIESVNNQ